MSREEETRHAVARAAMLVHWPGHVRSQWAGVLEGAELLRAYRRRCLTVILDARRVDCELGQSAARASCESASAISARKSKLAGRHIKKSLAGEPLVMGWRHGTSSCATRDNSGDCGGQPEAKLARKRLFALKHHGAAGTVKYCARQAL